MHHEGVPGHHTQTVIAMVEPDLHPWQRAMAHVHGHAEGWAHYAERLADEFGLLRDAGERLGMLYGQRWRAARIVVDMGLHLGFPIPAGNGITTETEWTPEIGAAVLQFAGGMDEAPRGSRSTATSAGPARRSPSGSARGCGNSCAPRRRRVPASTSSSSTCGRCGWARWGSARCAQHCPDQVTVLRRA